MSTPSWQINGQYHETCSCDFICPCIVGQMSVRPTKGSCTFAMAMQIERGKYGSVPLDGIGFVILGLTPEEMEKGNWSVGLIVDQKASTEQTDAITAIASGAAGGPMSIVTALVGKFLGVEKSPIEFDRKGRKWTVNASKLLKMGAEGVLGIDPNATEPMYLDNTGHPASNRLALAHASESHLHALGLSWDDSSGKNNGHYAPFSWKSA